MIIQPNYATAAMPASRNAYGERQNFAVQAVSRSDTVSISQAARNALAASATEDAQSVEARLAEIKSKNIITRTAEDMEYLYAHDDKLAAIRDKSNRAAGSLTSSEIDYVQKTVGFVNTMAYLSADEKQMYDDLVSSGNTEAAAGLGQIAFLRATMGHSAGGANDTSYDSIDTAITAENIANYFMHSFADKTGTATAQLQALKQYLETHPASPARQG